ncbi:MAG TPA: hypothetical protein ENL20_03580 [Candidatus Cloacimonetes bacterium]|nr:hypothetical protein [Candidatus Cloacimonadota bacterium]
MNIFQLPKKAEEHFNKRAKEFLYKLRPVNLNSNNKIILPKTSQSEEFAIQINKKDIINLRTTGQFDQFGNKIVSCFPSKQGYVGLDGNDLKEFLNFIETLSIRKELRDLLCYKFLQETTFKWFEKVYNGEIKSQNNYTDYLHSEIKLNVKERKISIPILHLSLEKSFIIGNIQFEVFSKKFFDLWEQSLNKCKKDNSKMLTKVRQNYQGVVFASLKAFADKNKCIEIAKQETERSLMILRIFSPTILYSSEFQFYYGRKGHVYLPSNYYFIFEDEFPQQYAMTDVKSNYKRVIYNKELEILKQYGFVVASNLLKKKNLTDMEELLLKTMNLFSRSIITENFEDKIVFSLVSIETLLLKNTSEPIQYSIGKRLAFLISNTPKERKKTDKLVKEAYKLRSNYIHHGNESTNIKIIEKLRFQIFIAISKILLSINHIKTQEQLLEKIENKIWGSDRYNGL